jgi:hypothetical protein
VDGGRLATCVSTIIHFSTATLVHSSVVADQRVCVNHPQAYAQGTSLAGPGAGMIGACSHAGPGLRPEPPVVRHEGNPGTRLTLLSYQVAKTRRMCSAAASAATGPTYVRLSPIRYTAPGCLNDLHRPVCVWFASRWSGTLGHLAHRARRIRFLRSEEIVELSLFGAIEKGIEFS